MLDSNSPHLLVDVRTPVELDICQLPNDAISILLQLYIGFYQSAHVLLNLFNGLSKRDKCEACRAFYLFFAKSLINSIKQGHKC